MSAMGLRRPPSPPSAAGRLAADPATALVVAATLLGFALRAAASGGDLGLDEVWSLKLVARVPSLGGVFWGISHDNNHLLNSAWLYLLGQDAPVRAYRLPAVILGTLTVPALARLCWRWSREAGGLAALLAAVAAPLVDFGSEARGYAGLALATVLALDAGGRALDAHRAGDRAAGRREAWRLGAAVGFGLLSHLTMAVAAAVLGLAALIRAGARRHPLAAARIALRVLGPSALLALPAIGCLVAGVALRGGFTVGDSDPFAWGKLVAGYGGMAALTAGLPGALPPLVGAAGALALLAAAARSRLASPWVLALAAAALIALPLGVAALRPPNVVYPRYFSVCGIVLLALLAETLAALWRRGGEGRRAAAISILAMAGGGLALDASEIREGRGGFTDTLAVMAAEGAPTYAADRPFMAGLLLDEAARRAGRAAPVPVPEAALCRSPPDWFVAVGTEDRRPDGAAEWGAPACPTRYLLRRAYPASPLSGTSWTLYRRG